MKIVKFVDLFAGLGGIRLGFEQAFQEKGYITKCVLTSEIKKSAIQALKANFIQDNLQGDIRKIDSKDIEDFDFLLAGFPCQSFSFAGRGFGFADTRGTLFFEVERLLREKKPYGFILENVEGLILHDRENHSDKIGRTLKTILQKLDDLGYKVQWKLIDCKDFGVPQIRKRVFIVGTKDTLVSLSDFPVKQAFLREILETGKPTVKSHFTECLFRNFTPEQLYGKLIRDKRGGETTIHSWDIELRGKISTEQKELLNKLYTERRKRHWARDVGVEWMDGMPLTETQIRTFYDNDNLYNMLEDLVNKNYLKKEYPKKIKILKPDSVNEVRVRVPDTTKELGYNIIAGQLSFEFTIILDPNRTTQTLVSMDISHVGVMDNNGIRKLTIREVLRLFGYPETYTLNMFENTSTGLTKAYDLLGNSVVVPAIKSIALRLEEAYSKH